MVTASAIQPPVQDSAVASISPRVFSACPTSSARRYSFSSDMTSSNREKSPPQRQQQQDVECRDQVIEHHAEAVLEGPVVVANRLRLENIEHPEQQERAGLPKEGVRREEQDQHKRDDLVPHHAAVV